MKTTSPRRQQQENNRPTCLYIATQVFKWLLVISLLISIAVVIYIAATEKVKGVQIAIAVAQVICIGVCIYVAIKESLIGMILFIIITLILVFVGGKLTWASYLVLSTVALAFLYTICLAVKACRQNKQ